MFNVHHLYIYSMYDSEILMNKSHENVYILKGKINGKETV